MLSVASRLSTSILPAEQLQLARRPNPKRSLFSSLKFCSICIRQLYNFMISRGLKSSVLLNINHGSFAADLAYFICDGLAIPQRERLFLLSPAFRLFFVQIKMTIATGVFRPGKRPRPQIFRFVTGL